jgi:hypothetical protein
MFNKEAYWDRRKLGFRGQPGEYFRHGMGIIIGRDTTKHEKPGSYLRTVLRPAQVHGRGRRRRAEIARINQVHERQLANVGN